MFDDLRQPLPKPDPELIDGGEKQSRWDHPLTIMALMAAIVLLFGFIIANQGGVYRDYSVKCYQQGIVIYNGDIRQYSSSSIYNNIETGARVILPQGSCVFTEILPQK